MTATMLQTVREGMTSGCKVEQANKGEEDSEELATALHASRMQKEHGYEDSRRASSTACHHCR